VCAPPFGESEHVQHVYVHTNTNTNTDTDTKQWGYRCGPQWRRRIKDSLFFPSRIRSYQQVLLCSSNYTITPSRKYTCQDHVMIAFMHGLLQVHLLVPHKWTTRHQSSTPTTILVKTNQHTTHWQAFALTTTVIFTNKIVDKKRKRETSRVYI